MLVDAAPPQLAGVRLWPGRKIGRPLRIGPGRSASPQGGRDIRKAAKPPTAVQSLRPTWAVIVNHRSKRAGSAERE